MRIDPHPEEEWRPCFGGLYAASSLGRVKRIAPKTNGDRCHGRVLSAVVHKSGRLAVAVWSGNRRKVRGVHQLVAEAFLGPRPEGMEVNHKDGNHRNNTPENLEYLTHRENCQHAARLGLTRTGDHSGERNGCALLRVQQVREIRGLLAQGLKQVELARRFRVSKSTVEAIASRRTWRRVS